MTDEKLIEDAAAALDEELSDVANLLGRDRVRNLARAALAVFEKAHTPTNGSCWDAAPQIIRDGVHDPMPTLCELTAGHLGAHRSGQTEWMHSRPPGPQGEPSDAQVRALKVLQEVEPLAEVFGSSTAFGRAVIALRRLVDDRTALRGTPANCGAR